MAVRHTTDHKSAGEASRRVRRSRSALGRVTDSGVYSRTPDSLRTRNSDEDIDLSRLLDVYVADGQSEVAVAIVERDPLPTVHYPQRIFHANVTAVTAWVDHLRDSIRSANLGPQVPGPKPHKAKNARDKRLKVSQDEAFADAKEALSWLDEIERLIREGADGCPTSALAMACAYYVGRLAERMVIRTIEPDAAGGRASVQGGVSVAKLRAEAARDRIAKRNAEWQAEINDSVHPQGESYAAVTKRIAERDSVSLPLVRDATDNPHPRNKGGKKRKKGN